MPQTLQTDRDQIIERAAEAGERQGCAEVQLRAYLARYYRHVALEDLARRDPVDLAGAALSHRQLAGRRPQGTANVRVFTPTVDEHAWSNGHTVLEIVTDDMPFLVDSVTAELSKQDRGIHLLVHPQVAVRRDVTGALLEVLDVTPGAWDGDGPGREVVVESWIHVEIDRETDPATLESLAAGVHAVLDDVRVAVEDWPRMKQRAREIAAALVADPPAGIDPAEVDQAQRLLHWLADDHFTFLGYRSYRLVDRDGRDRLAAETGSGLGILRYDQVGSSSFERLTTQARAKARERSLLILTKANSRSTVHSSSYMYYICVKVFDSSGVFVG